MSGTPYTGPIVDAHHHFWDLGLRKHPWLDPSTGQDELAPIRRNHLPTDYLPLAREANIAASVHVEANWDPEDPLGEARWLDTLERPAGIAARYIAYAPLLDPQAAAILEQHAARERVVGIREILSWHPDPQKRRIPDKERMTNPIWRRNLALCRGHDFIFELLLSPWQLEDARRLADDFPDITFILNHCGSPMDRDAEGMRRWSDGLRLLAGAPNVSIKVSDPVAYDPDWTFESLSRVILTCIDCFGPSRSLFASDDPVAGLYIGFSEWLSVFAKVTRHFSADEKAAMFHENAHRLYRFPGLPRGPANT